MSASTPASRPPAVVTRTVTARAPAATTVRAPAATTRAATTPARTCFASVPVGPDSDCQTVQQLYGAFATVYEEHPATPTYQLTRELDQGGHVAVYDCQWPGPGNGGNYTCVSETDAQDWMVFDANQLPAPG